MFHSTHSPAGRTIGTRIGLALGAMALTLGSGVAMAAPASASATTGLENIEDSLLHVYIEYSGYVGIPGDDGVTWSDRVTVGFMCTGWFASDEGHIATAGHCVDPEDGRAELIAEFLASVDAEDLYSHAVTNWPVEGYDPGSDIDHTIEVVQTSGAEDPVIDEWTVAELVDYQEFESGDAALLKVAGVSGTAGLEIAYESPQVGDEIVSIGFPGTVQNVVDVRRLAASFKTGTVSSHQVTDGGVPVIEINAQVSQGMSGGPTIDSDGNVIGINSFGINGESQSFNFVTDTEGLAAFLERNGVTIAQAAETADTATARGSDGAEGAEVLPASAPAGSTQRSSDGGILVPVLVGMGGIVLIGTAVVVIVLLARRTGSPAAPAAPVEPLGAPLAYPVAPAAASVGFAPASAPAVPAYLQAPPAPPAAQAPVG